MLDGATPSQVVRLFRKIVEAAEEIIGRDRRDPVPAIAAMSVSAFMNWDSELAAWFRKYTDPRTRLFLIALAFLEGEPAADVLDRSERLGATLGEARDFRGGIGTPGIRQLAQDVVAEVDELWQIRFTRAAYAASVLAFVHGDQSREFRRRLWEWAAVLPMRNGPPNLRIAGRVAAAMLDMHLAMPSPNTPELRFLVQSWWPHPALRPVVTNLITALALSPEAGSIMRRRLLQWAAEAADSRVLGAVAAVSAGSFADAYPQAAFTRMNWLAARGIVNDEVIGAVTALWQRPAHRTAVLRQVVSWTGEDGPRRMAGLRALAAISEEPSDVRAVFGELAGDDELRADLARMLADLFRQRGEPSGEFRQALKAWLEIAGERPEDRDLIAHLLIHGRPAGLDDGMSTHCAAVHSLLFEWRPVLGQDENSQARKFRTQLVRQLTQIDPLTRHRADPLAVAG
ncbi:hypothetical protein Asi03nite_64830 [Actinoplanes siamensis]|uniref:Uncharacterized protein n=1 Tax=Actinoplanes siamensis TaxID=1223317 RepID=A0A919NDW6_9ACTN|nr:hypothetical protein Asi03nite_64830 [Actinoplanes siamensis]